MLRDCSIEAGSWSKHDDVIGVATLPDGKNEADLIGAEKETRYALVKPSGCL